MSTSRRSLTSEKSGMRYISDEYDDGARQVTPSNMGFKWHDASATPASSAPLPELSLAGDGEAYDECGNARPVKFCEDCGKPTWGRRACRRPRCPECWESWDRKRTVAAASKLEAERFRRQRTDDDGNAAGEHHKMHHVAVSPPAGFETGSDDALGTAFDIVKELIEECGAETGYIIYHPWRIKQEYIEEGYAWKDIVDRDDWRKFVYFAPHFHVFCLSPYLMGGDRTKGIEEETGWVVERITKVGSNVSLYNLRDLVAATAYCFSHAGVDGVDGDDDRVNPQKTMRYFGTISNKPAFDATEEMVEDAFADVAPRVLGIDAPRGSCGEVRYRPSSTSTASPSDDLDGPDLPDAPAVDDLSLTDDGPDLSPSTDDDEDDTEGCGGRLRPFYEAPQYMVDAIEDGEDPPPDLLRAVGFWILTK